MCVGERLLIVQLHLIFLEQSLQQLQVSLKHDAYVFGGRKKLDSAVYDHVLLLGEVQSPHLTSEVYLHSGAEGTGERKVSGTL